MIINYNSYRGLLYRNILSRFEISLVIRGLNFTCNKSAMQNAQIRNTID